MKAQRLNARDRRIANDLIHMLTTEYHNEIPIGAAITGLKAMGLVVLQEDGTPWEGFIAGREGRATFELGVDGAVDERGCYKPVQNALCITWYKMPSGRYEFVGYIS